MDQKFTHTKKERLCSKIIIDEMFASASSFYSYPFRVLYIINPSPNTGALCQSLFSIPKRNFKKAVDRNLLKRRTREAFRLHKHDLHQQLSNNNTRNAVLFIYTAKEQLEYAAIEKGVVKALKKLSSLALPNNG